MKGFIFLFVLTLPFILRGQSQIMDAHVDWTGSNIGTASIYLDNENDLSSVRIEIGSTAGANDLSDQQYAIGSLPAGSTNIDNVVRINMGSITSAAHYFVRYTITLSDNSIHIIELEE